MQLPLNIKKLELEASYERYDLIFKKPAKTSRETFTSKDTYVLRVKYKSDSIVGTGECSPLWTLSIDPKSTYTDKLDYVCQNINNWEQLLDQDLHEYPSIKFGLETALLDLSNGGKGIIFPSKYTEGKDKIEINGLIWMGDYEYMSAQIDEKIAEGYKCVKLKIGAINWEKELQLLKKIRTHFSEDEIEIRVDANGAFEYSSALEKLNELAKLNIHSIEQPIAAGQWEKMYELCRKSPIPIALDEELIPIQNFKQKEILLQTIQPQYIILKPSLLGGISATQEWIDLAEKHNIKWWITSALEGNIALRALSQFVYQTGNKLPQGLGTGGLFENNFEI